MRNMYSWLRLPAVILCTVIFPAAAQAQLNGTYTIDVSAAATATNYLSLTAAVSDLTTGTRPDGGPVSGPGVSGPVTLRIAAGTGPYSEQVTIGNIPGTSSLNPVRITGGPSMETVLFQGTTTADRHVIRLSGCSWVTLDSLTIINRDAANGYGVHITNSADYNTVQNCYVSVDSSLTTTAFAGITISGATVAANGDWGDYNTIQNNEVYGGYYGLTCRGTSTTVKNQGNQFLNNTVRSSYFYGVYTLYQNDLQIVGNRVTVRDPGTASAYGIYGSNIDQFRIENNVVPRFGLYGIYITGGNLAGSSRATVVNNMIGGANTSTASPYGIYLLGTPTNVDVFHNSVLLTAGNGRAYFQSTGTGVEVKNNTFAILNSTTGYAAYITTASTVSGCDYNNYYAPGSSNFVFIGSAFTPATYIGGAGYNANSRNQNPGHVSTTDLHIGFGTALWDAGTNVGVNTDIDGDARPLAPTALPEIGADEYTPMPNDAGVWSLNSPVQPFAAGVQNVDVSIHNYGVLDITAAQIGWSVNGVLQTPYAWSGTLAPAATSAPVTLGTYNFAAGTVYALKFWTSNPNGSPDPSVQNDTLRLNVCTAYAGTYTIGPGSNFLSVQEAYDALECGGVSAPVTLRFRAGSGPYNERVFIDPIPGTSAVNTVRLTGGTAGNTITWGSSTTSERAVIKVRGADYLIFDSLSVLNTSTAAGYGFQLLNQADYNTIRACTVAVDSASTSTNFACITLSGATVTTDGNHGNYTTIQDNITYGGYYAITLRGTSTTSHCNGNKVLGNDIRSLYNYGIYCYSQNDNELVGNRVQYRNTASTSAYGIYTGYNDRFRISENTIHRPGGYGIYVTNGNVNGGGTRARIFNNMIGGGCRSTGSPYGIYMLSSTTNVDVHHNTVYLDNGNGRAAYITTTAAGNNIRNNSFAVTGSTGYALYVTNAGAVNGVNYNNYYAPNSANFVYIGAAYTPATYIGGGGFNLNSVSGDPQYMNPSTDLHVSGVVLNNVGDNTVGILADIDGDVRPAPAAPAVDIGADEYSPLLLDAASVTLLDPVSGLCPDSFQVVRVVMRNLGMNTLTNVPVNLDITGFYTISLNGFFAGPIATNEYDTLTLGTINTWNGGTLDFELYTQLSGDQRTGNDTLRFTRIFSSVPAAPPTQTVQICGSDSVLLTVPASAAQHFWYDAQSGGTLLASSVDSFQTPVLSVPTTYWVEARTNIPGSLTTSFAGGNGCQGNMFNLTANSTITLDSFDVHYGVGGTLQTEVYYKAGTYLGFETNAAAWTLLGSAPVASASMGNPSRLPVGGLTIPAGQTYAIYIKEVTGTDMDYTNGTSTYSNSDLTLTNGAGLCSTFGGVNAGRMFNGRVYYTRSGCGSDRSGILVNINTPPSVSLGPDTAFCEGPVYVLDAANPGLNILWSTADTTQTLSVSTSGTYSVMVDNNGCTAADTVVVTVHPLPVVNLGADTTVCTGVSLTLDAGNAGAAWNWCDGSTTQTVQASAAGQYCVSVTNPAGCAAADTLNLSLNTVPQVAFTADTTPCPLIQFLDASTGTPATAWAWDFGDGGTSISQFPAHTYASDGNYAVTLIATNACGSDTLTQVVTVDCLVRTGDALQQGVSLWPNPNDGRFRLQVQAWEGKRLHIRITDLRGVTVWAHSPSLNGVNYAADLDLSHLSRGVYLVHLEGDAGETVLKLVVE